VGTKEEFKGEMEKVSGREGKLARFTVN